MKNGKVPKDAAKDQWKFKNKYKGKVMPYKKETAQRTVNRLEIILCKIKADSDFGDLEPNDMQVMEGRDRKFYLDSIRNIRELEQEIELLKTI